MAKEKKNRTKDADNIKKNTGSKDTLFPNGYGQNDNLSSSNEEPNGSFLTPRVKNINLSSGGLTFAKPLYIQIAAENIYSVFSKALILPYAYLGDKVFPDVQSIYRNGLIISNGIIDPVSNILLLEIRLTKDEEARVQINDAVGIIDFPLPISRIKKIYTVSAAVKNEIYKTAIANDGGIIPEKLIEIIPKSLKTVTLPKIVLAETTLELDSINLYDKVLGAFAYLGNYNLLLAKRTNILKTLSDHFLFALQALTKDNAFEIIVNERATNFYRQLFGVKAGESAIFSWLIERLISGENFHDEDVAKFANLLADNVINKDFLHEVRSTLTALNKSLERKTAIRNIPALNDSDKFYLYLFAILRQYGSLNSEDRSISRADLPDLIHLPYAEYTFACLGFFYGYTALRNYEERQVIEDEVFQFFVNGEKRQAIKFKLEDKFDLNVIETIYQFTFNKQISKSPLDYLPNPCASQSLQRRLSNDNVNAGYSQSTIQVLDRFIYNIKRKTLTEQIDEKLAKLGSEIPGLFTEIGLFCHRKNLPWSFGNINALISNPKEMIKYFVSFKKVDLVEAINTGKIDSKEALKALTSGLDNNEL
ncbi:hypothetical protein MUGA111182_03505 [Mucilaginibacter galii]|uniref:Uncharacterized protein n=1 Tax=Mucilaginibacter galii TaxID=2005073 RepID=A0A917N121_9SPHI|nr:hypothetical protein [Mucilaginibacter galii]GGI50450.1 hypothetical protein GCM10011425_16620 [Mucilaginibacter galii]